MRKDRIVFFLMAALFFAAVLLAGRMSSAQDKPYSSYSAGTGGTKAAYLLLQELGFQVERNRAPNWNGEGILIALGSDYLPDTENTVTLPVESRFTNATIRKNASQFVSQMMPYRDQVIVFQEYGRSAYPLGGDAASETNLLTIAPDWLKLLVLGAGLIVVFLLVFYKQRLGEPKELEAFSIRPPLEGVFAMAATLEKANTYRDCCAYYYNYCGRNGSPWDKDGALCAGLDNLPNAEAAARLLQDIDESIKEYRHEGI